MDTLKKLNKSWISHLEGIEIIILPSGIAIAFLLAYLDILELPIGAGLTFISSFTSVILHHLAVYNLVRCPECGENLAKFKNGKNIPINQLYNGFAKCSPCKHCGWAASKGV
ncbi:hypothetical protein MHM87_15535 [Alteromonas sp. Cnat3-28]|uniref:hypothetical protein n=1 Tax=Alteromonas sp. Cnat3-28 TaxID=2917729 RepID=UPI001EF54E09|nr:hypothetical protein [Alteromonas sp. Cnat3-28]MCG7646992.1 hypothetical protein [Alteromonas sp. Cnat3-28]